MLRLGLVVNFLSHPVVNGFTNAAAIIIATSQLSKMFGVHVDTAEHHYETIIAGDPGRPALHPLADLLSMGAAPLPSCSCLKRIAPRIPNVLVAVVITTLISWAIGFQHNDRGAVSTPIQSPEARTLITRFNQTVRGISPPWREQRTEASQALDEGQSRPDAIAVLDARARRQELIHLQIEDLTEQGPHVPEETAGPAFTLRGVPQPDGSTLILPDESRCRPGSRNDGGRLAHPGRQQPRSGRTTCA